VLRQIPGRLCERGRVDALGIHLGTRLSNHRGCSEYPPRVPKALRVGDDNRALSQVRVRV
jgi:hypothetical protein